MFQWRYILYFPSKDHERKSPLKKTQLNYFGLIYVFFFRSSKKGNLLYEYLEKYMPQHSVKNSTFFLALIKFCTPRDILINQNIYHLYHKYCTKNIILTPTLIYILYKYIYFLLYKIHMQQGINDATRPVHKHLLCRPHTARCKYTRLTLNAAHPWSCAKKLIQKDVDNVKTEMYKYIIQLIWYRGMFFFCSFNTEKKGNIVKMSIFIALCW